jgi:hypothetical protein
MPPRMPLSDMVAVAWARTRDTTALVLRYLLVALTWGFGTPCSLCIV